MKKQLLAACVLFISSMGLQAQTKFGIANHLSVGASIETDGAGFDVSTCLTKYLQLSAGMIFMPNFSLQDEADVSGTVNGQQYQGTMDIEGTLKRTQGFVKLDIYPFPSKSVSLVGGLYFGGDDILKVTGYSKEMAQLIAQGSSLGVNIGQFQLPVDKNGYAAGGVQANSVRPYLGLGFGRPVPKSRLGFRFEIGCQFHGSLDLRADGFGDLKKVLKEAGDDDISEIMDKLTIYPVIRFSLRGRIF